MTCPACKRAAKDGQEVHKMTDREIENRRVRLCTCGARWVTIERLVKGSLVTSNGVTGDHCEGSQVTSKRSQVTFPGSRVTLGDLGGLPSGIGSGSDPARSGSLEASGSEVLRKIRKSPASLPGFDRFYAEYPRKVAKPHALAMWKREGCEEIAATVLLGLRIHLPDLTSRPRDKVPHPATFLTGRRWEDEPSVAPGATGSVPGPSASRADYCDDHLDRNQNLWSSRPTSTCPACKHLRAKYPKHPRVVSMENLFGKGA